MSRASLTLLLASLVLQLACNSPMGSPEGSGGATGSGGMGNGGTIGSGGAGPATKLGLGGSGGTSTLTLAGSGTGGSFIPQSDPNFDPSLLIPIDAGAPIDGGGDPSSGIIIFDRSGSMATNWTINATDNPDSAAMVTKWVAASRALIDALVPVQDRVTVGAVLFPSDSGCGVAPFGDPLQFTFMPGREFIDQYIARSPYEQPDGNTPLTVAFQVADQAIKTAQSQGLLRNRFFVMLLTDGEPNCNSDMAEVLSLASSWLTQGIQTYVFGLPGSESARMVLDSVAQAGGTQAIAVPGSPGELQTGIAAVF